MQGLVFPNMLRALRQGFVQKFVILMVSINGIKGQVQIFFLMTAENIFREVKIANLDRGRDIILLYGT